MASVKNLISPTVKQRIKYKLSDFGYYDKRALDLNIYKLYSEDVFVSSYPKSGNTWVRFIIANLLSPNEEVSFRNIEQYVQDIHKSKRIINSIEGRRFIKSHDQDFQNFPRFIYVVRDGRDVMVSYYHYQVKRNRFQGTFAEFIRSERVHIYGSWNDHVKTALTRAYTNFSNDILLLKYETMLANQEAAVKKIADFCGFQVNDQDIKLVVQKCAFDSLKENEAKHGSEGSKENLGFFRSGSSGDWRDHFTEDDHNYFLWHSSEMLIKNGYDLKY